MADQKLKMIVQAEVASAVKNLKKVQTGTDAISKSVKTQGAAFSDAAGKAKLWAAAGAVAAGALTKKMIDVASDAEEIQSKFNVVFRGIDDEMNLWAEDFATTVGRANQDIKMFTSGIADVLKPMGLQTEAAAKMSQEMTALALDVASFNNRQDADVIHSFTSALTGERESLKTLGIVINEADVKTEAYRAGIVKVGEELTKEAKAQATMNLLFANTADAQGDLARTSESYANQVKAMRSEIKNLAEEIGKDLLPIATDAVHAIKEMTTFVSENKDAIVGLTKAAVGLAVAIGGAMMIGKLNAFSAAAKTAMMRTGSLGGAISKLPRAVKISIALIGVEAVITGVNFLLDKMDELRDKQQARTETKLELARSASNELRIARSQAVVDEAAVNVLKEKAQILALEARAQTIANKESNKIFGDKLADNKELLGIEAEHIRRTEKLNALTKNLNESQKASIARISAAAASGGITATPEVEDVVGGGGGGTGTSAADATVAAQAKILESLIDTRTGFSELRTDGVNALSDLAREHDVRMGEMVDEAKELIASLGEIESAYNIRVAGFDQSAAEQVLAQEDVIAELQKKIAETAATGESTSELQSRLEREKSVLRDFLAENEDLTDEIAAARARASLTDFERFTSDLEIKREAAAADYQKEIEQIQTRLVNLQTSRDEEVAIYETKRDAIASMNDSISLYWSDTLTRMENRTEEAAAMMAAKLAAVRDSFAGIGALSGDNSSAADVQTSSDFTSGQYSAGSNPAINLNFGDVNISNGQDAQNFFAELEAKLTRVLQLQNLGSTS